jgi:hypothetical protein
MTLLLAHPAVAARDCGDCQAWMYDEASGQRVLRHGEPIVRPRHSRPPCWSCPKCAGREIKNPESGRAASLSPKNVRALRCYFELQAVGGLASEVAGGDRMLLRNLGVIHETLCGFERGQLQALIAQLGDGS